jgi:quinol-cytochrome oxidoreductase complex cytochrome b subunit
MTTDLDPRPEALPQRVWDSIQRDQLPPADDRERMKLVMNNLVLHLHPSKVSKPTLRFTYTWGLGGLALLLIVILAGTGVLLMFAYTPSPDQAYSDMLALLLLVVGENFTGYLLPWDQLAYWAVTVGSSLLSYVPLVGEPLRNFLLGGPEVSGATLTNFYGLHVAILPLTLMGIVSFHIWRVRKDTLTIPHNVDGSLHEPNVKVTTIPHLLSIEVVFALVMTGLILMWSVWVNAPLEGAANPDHSPNPAKAAWYFMGLQELLLHFHPTFGAIVIPALALVALASLPYQRFDMQAEGVWFRSQRGRTMAIVAAVAALVLTPALVLLDEYWLDLPALLPSLPTILSNGWVPLAALLLGLMAFYEIMQKAFRATACETRQSVFVLLVVGFLVLTVIGVFFRGEGMALMWPWEVMG